MLEVCSEDRNYYLAVKNDEVGEYGVQRNLQGLKENFG